MPDEALAGSCGNGGCAGVEQVISILAMPPRRCCPASGPRPSAPRWARQQRPEREQPAEVNLGSAATNSPSGTGERLSGPGDAQQLSHLLAGPVGLVRLSPCKPPLWLIARRTARPSPAVSSAPTIIRRPDWRTR